MRRMRAPRLREMEPGPGAAPDARKLESGAFRIGEIPRPAGDANAPPSGRTLDELDFPTPEETPLALDLRPPPAAKRRADGFARVAPGAQRPVIHQPGTSSASMTRVGVVLLVVSFAGVAAVVFDVMK